LFHKISDLSIFPFVAEDDRNLILKKVEPWNSVRVTFNIPASAAHRLRELAERRDQILRELGILAVQIDGDHVISLTVSSSEDKLTSASIAIQPKQNVPKKSELLTQDQFFKPPPAQQPVQDINQTVVQQNTSIPAAVVFTPQDVTRTSAVAVVVPSQPGLRPVLIDCRPRVPSLDQSCAPRMDVMHPPASWPMGLAQWSDPRAAAAVLMH
jgi:Putative nucleic acid-binding region